jgi:hypothetical protein
MSREEAKSFSVFSSLGLAVADFGLLVKFKLTLLVLFSAVMSYAVVCNGNVDCFRWAGFLSRVLRMP